MSRHYDLVAIGSGPAGQRAAIQAAKLGKSAAVIEKADTVGGAAINRGTIPSKALREAVAYLTGATKRDLFVHGHREPRDITFDELVGVTSRVQSKEVEKTLDAFSRNGIDLVWGAARLVGGHDLVVEGPDGIKQITADNILIATGSRPVRPDTVPFNDRNIVCTDTLRNIGRIPASMVVVGGGVIGTEFASIFATLGVEVTLVESRAHLLGFIDLQVIEYFEKVLRHAGVELCLGERVASIEDLASSGTDPALVDVKLESGRQIKAEGLLFAAGRQGVVSDLGLEEVGIEYDTRGRLAVNDKFQTAVDYIYAVGDVIGFPALAATSMEQGRLAACHALGAPGEAIPKLLPYGVYSIPELSMVGETEEQLTDKNIPYEIGVAEYGELARGHILGDEMGLLKLLIHKESRKILGVHCLGTMATELVHIGQMVMIYGGTVDDLVDNVFNFPTLAEAYKVAAHNAVNKLSQG